MNHRPLRSAFALSLGAVLAFAGGAAADTAKADGDILTPDTVETILNIGPVAPGEVRSVQIGIVLTCTGTAHVDPGQTVTAGINSASAPEGGAILSVTDGTVGPAPADWPAEGQPCASPAQMFSTGTPSVVTLRAPTTPGTGYVYPLQYHRSIEPFGINDPAAIRQLTAIDIVLDVVVNSPPTLVLPTVAGGTIEAATTGGWTADWSGLGATDTEDDPDPTASCSAAAGALLPLGTTSVTCTVTDSGDMSDSATFDVTVADTTRPTLTGVPTDQFVTTADPTGTTLTYAAPAATDVADAAPSVTCLPASGSHVGPGTTTVTCTAADASANTVTDSFDVTVTYVAPHTASVTWGEPVDGPGSTFSANRGRTIPIKVELFVDGVVRTTGDANLTVTPCGGGSPVTIALTRGSGRWNAALDTSPLVGSCHTVGASIDGLAAGSFQLELRGAEPAKAGSPRPATTGTVQPTTGGDTTSTTGTTKPGKTKDEKPKPSAGKH